MVFDHCGKIPLYSLLIFSLQENDFFIVKSQIILTIYPGLPLFIGYPHYSPQKELWKQVQNLPDKLSNPGLLMGELIEISDPNERQSQTNGSPTKHEKFKRFIS